MFIDSAKIFVQSGKGGKGCVSFLRERRRPRGGPDGGDGGRGGDVILRAEPHLHTLLDFRYRHKYYAQDGELGKGRNCSGKSGASLIIPVPVGTLIYDDETGIPIADFDQPGAELIVLRGGRGGKGNAHFASSTFQTPRFAQPGEPEQTKWLRLELKLLADVGIIGFPNVGKSTFISRISAARPKIADFPFTTLVPHLGVVRVKDEVTLVFADIPGIIEGAHRGKGLGLTFLRHIERTKLLLHFIDPCTSGERDPVRDYHTLNGELASYHAPLEKKPQIVVINKCDVTEARENASGLQKQVARNSIPLFHISAVTGEGIEELLNYILHTFSQRTNDIRANRNSSTEGEGI